MDKVERYDVYELTLRGDSELENPFTDAELRSEFAGPGGTFKVDGFYYGGGEWRVRFVPNEPGEWEYEAVLEKGVPAAEPVRSSGAFECTDSDRHGFVRISRRNPYRFVCDDGTPFYPVGEQTGWGVAPTPPFDAPDDSEWRTTDRESFMEAFTGSVNLVRSQLGCGTTDGVAMDIIKKGSGDTERYDLENCLKVDESCAAIKRFGWAQIVIPIQDMSPHGDRETAFGMVQDIKGYKSLRSRHLGAIERYLRYVVARWGAYTDIWEIFNEDSYSPDDFLAHLAEVIRCADPYGHPITTNYERPGAGWCDVVCPHEYVSKRASFVPGHLSAQFGRLKSYGKPVLYTEFGNKAILSNDDPVKWRVAAWTAFMMEGGMVYWNMSGRRTKPNRERPWANSNAYLGAETRRHFRILADFTRDLPVTLRPVTIYTAGRIDVEAWVLAGDGLAVVYLHNPGDDASATEPTEFPASVGPGTWRVTWIDPATGETVATDELETVQQFLGVKCPPVKIDLAGRLERG